jgi:cell volume regulation protein A
MKKKILNYIIALCSLLTVFFISFYSKEIWHSIEASHEHAILGVFFLTAIMFMLSSLVYHVANLLKLPSFVVAIFLGILAKPFLEPIISNQGSLSVLVGLGATLILFGGGLETPFHNFKKLILKIFSLSFPGLLITAFLTSLSIYTIGNMMGLGLSILVAVLLGAVLASTDPAAIIPILKRLKFKNRSVKDIVISESAFTDVTGTLLTLVFLSIIGKGIFFDNISAWYYSVFSLESGIVIQYSVVFINTT